MIITIKRGYVYATCAKGVERLLMVFNNPFISFVTDVIEHVGIISIQERIAAWENVRWEAKPTFFEEIWHRRIINAVNF